MDKEKRKVFIVSPDSRFKRYSLDYERMFRMQGWILTNKLNDANLIQFTGGADVCPIFYNQKKHPKTNFMLERDKREALVYFAARKLNKKIAGICRGAQFLNVMCGGSLYQHVEGHTQKHPALDCETGNTIMVTSTHHQMMIPARSKDVDILLTANVTKVKEKCSNNRGTESKILRVYGESDIEALIYKDKKVLCFQPHPEFLNEKETEELYFTYIDKHLY